MDPLDQGLRIKAAEDCATTAGAPKPAAAAASWWCGPELRLFFCAVFHCLCSGTFYGFWQFTAILRAEGAYRDACPGGEGGCTAQDLAFANLYTNTSVLAFGVPLLSGLFMRTAGPRSTVLALTSFFAIGFGLLLGAALPGPGQLVGAYILPAFCCIGIAAAANYLPLLSVASLFTRSSIALSCLSGSFDAGSGVFLIMRLMHAAGVPTKTLLAAFLGGPILVMFAFAVLLWRDEPFRPPPAIPSSPRSVQAALAASGSVRAKGAFWLEGGKGEEQQQQQQQQQPAAAEPQPPLPPAPPIAVAVYDAPTFLPGLNTRRLGELPLHWQMLTSEYLLFFAYFCILSLRFNYYLASVNSQLAALGTAEEVSTLVNALGFLMPTCAIPAVLIAGYVLDTRGPLAGLTLLSLLATLLSTLQMIPNLKLQGFTALVFVLFRGALFSSLSVFLSLLFGFGNLGALVGVITALSGVFSLLTTPLMTWALGSPQGFQGPNALILALCFSTLAFPLWMAVKGGHKSLFHALCTPRQ